MKNKTLLRTNLLVCLIIILGFAITAVISYRSNLGIYQQDMEQVSNLASEGIYNKIKDIFSQPVSVSLTMANDSLLKTFLSTEESNLESTTYLDEMKSYLEAYRKKYNYDSVFLVSTNTNRYYHFSGVDRTLEKGDPENVWYYSFLENDEEYSLNVDNDQTTESGSITVFVNCKIKADDGSTLGVVGVGMQVTSLQSLLKSYEDEYNVSVHLVNSSGIIEISAQNTGYDGENLFDNVSYSYYKDDILSETEDWSHFWYSTPLDKAYVVSRYEPNLKWHLIVENDTAIVLHKLSMQLVRGIIVISFIIVLVLFTITIVIRKYNAEVVRLTLSQELEYQRLIHESTEELYEEIFEFDLTRNCASGDSTKNYFEKIGIARNATYSDFVKYVAKTQLKEEYVQKYLDIFSPKNVLDAYQHGINNLNFDFMISTDHVNYHWIRVTSRLFFWNSDESVRMITYRQNIDSEKRRELHLIDGIQRDPMTNLYNKRATEDLITQSLSEDLSSSQSHAFLIFDIDNFKQVNDTHGHSFGDHVIHELADTIKSQFRESDITGRVGGDEFAVLMKNIDGIPALKRKLTRVCARLNEKNVGVDQEHHISCSIGVAIFKSDGTTYSELYEKADQALYHAKSHGKNFFALFSQL